MINEERIDGIYQEMFKTIEEKAEEVEEVYTQSPHPSTKGFILDGATVTAQLGKGLMFDLEEQQAVSEKEFRSKVPESEAEFLVACAEAWLAVGRLQSENLSIKYLEKYA